MKIVINKCFGKFEVSEWLCRLWNIENNKYSSITECRGIYDFNSIDMRTNPAFVSLVKRFGNMLDSNLKVVDIPNEATDFMIDEYDGLERIIAVVNGKLCIIS